MFVLPLVLQQVLPLGLQQVFVLLPELVLEGKYLQKAFTAACCSFVLHGKLLRLLPLPLPLFQLPAFCCNKAFFSFSADDFSAAKFNCATFNSASFVDKACASSSNCCLFAITVLIASLFSFVLCNVFFITFLLLQHFVVSICNFIHSRNT